MPVDAASMVTVAEADLAVFASLLAVIVAVVVAATLLFVFLRDAGRRPVSVWPAVAVFGMAMAALLLRHLASGVPRSLAGMLTGLAGYGYPSGHVARTTVLAGTALRRLPVLGAGIVGAMMLALVYLGDHWASEVLGGLCLGWACAEVCTRAWQRAGETSRRRGR
jgi:membrane-associated phospholipid phosphatase